MQQQQQPLPKGNINELWAALGVTFNDREVIWQDYNPYPKLVERFPEFIFIGKGSGAEEPFAGSNPVTGGLQQLLALFAGSISPAPNATTRFEPLIETGRRTGVVAFDDLMQRSFLGSSINPNRRQRQTGQTYVLAAHITGSAPATTAPPATSPAAQPAINVILVSDIDVLYSVFFNLRTRERDKQDPLNLNLDNVTFVLNALDYLAGDDRFIDIRKRRPAYRTLSAVESRTEAARQKANDEREKYLNQFNEARDSEQKKLDQKIEELKARQGIDQMQMMQEVGTAQQAGQNRLNAQIEQMEKERDSQLDRIERDLSLNVRSVQNKYKLAAILFPPIPPLLVGAWMFYRRRNMEHIGVPKARLR
jgi:ABC-2 type transport system permease protein